jgi:putative SOS response-associated peptidase YedK
MLTTPVAALRQLLLFENLPNLGPRYNIAPSQEVAILRAEAEGRELGLARWGLVPFWAEEPKVGYKMINARAETVERLPAFREA